MSNQLMGVVMLALSETYDKIAKILKSTDEGDPDLISYQDLKKQYSELAMFVNQKNQGNLLVKRWTKRVIVDKRFKVDALKDYLETDPECEDIKEKLLGKISSGDVDGIDEL